MSDYKTADFEKSFSVRMFDVAGCRGGIWLRSCLILITLVIVGVLIFTLIRTLPKAQQENHRRAVAISEYGIQLAMQELWKSPSWTEGIERTAYDEQGKGWYEVNVQRKTNNDAELLVVRSRARMGSSESVKEWVLSLEVVDGDSLWKPVNIN